MTDPRIQDLMTELGARREGHFLLSSGRHSDTYFQCAQVLQFPDLALELGRTLADRLEAQDYDLVVSPAIGALLLGHEVARALGRRFVFTERKDGVMALRRDFRIETGEKVLIVEDVITRGTSTLEVADIVTAAGGAVEGVACLVDRTSPEVEVPAPVRSLMKVDVVSWDPAECPLCAQGVPVVKPGSRGA
ncbi:MAG TPA: orotate phosphoribosyltransferase [Candidatus Krumholzibacteria bacterium]|nr:orotate phosphoribosyltransferase [Candidatus Krumholzibacteria bacterium]